jgi:hypothetical protein
VGRLSSRFQINGAIYVIEYGDLVEFLMPTPEKPKPDPIPDMTLPERNDQPLESARIPDMTLPERKERERHIEKAPPVWERTVPGQGRWKVGDRVLAPWEPMFLYAGTIQEIDKIKAMIQFDDGDAGWVYVEQIRALSVRQGQKVFSRRKMGALFYAGEVLELRGDEVLVGFAAGGADEWTRIAALRIPSEDDDTRGAEPTKVASNQIFLESLRKGDRVWAPWIASVLFVGVVDAIKNDEAHIHFDDGDQGWVQLNQLLPFEPTVGMGVLGNWKMAGQYFPGAIARIDGTRILIRYDDGDVEWTTPRALALPVQPSGPDARPTKVVSHGSRRWIWYAVIGGAALLWILWSAFRK